MGQGVERRRFLSFFAGAAAVQLPLMSLAAAPKAVGKSKPIHDQPYFRFVPGAYRDKLCFEPSTDICEFCAKPCVWRYTGNVYVVREVERLCARCIANGNLARLLAGESFGFHDSEIAASASLWEEANHRTPGIPTFNPIEWPVIKGMPLAFMGSGDNTQVMADPLARKAVTHAYRDMGWNEPGDLGYALLFKEINGNRWRAVIDFD